jgi:hypothetical protein
VASDGILVMRVALCIHTLRPLDLLSLCPRDGCLRPMMKGKMWVKMQAKQLKYAEKYGGIVWKHKFVYVRSYLAL